MSVRRQKYQCDWCGSTKTIVFDSERVGREPTDGDFPAWVVCGVRYCENRQTPVERVDQ